jgi:hypothetical protein
MAGAINPVSDPRAESAELFLRVDRMALKRCIRPLLLVTVLVVLTLNSMPLTRLLTQIGVPMFLVRFPIALVSLIYFVRASVAAVRVVGSLVRIKVYRRY